MFFCLSHYSNVEQMSHAFAGDRGTCMQCGLLPPAVGPCANAVNMCSVPIEAFKSMDKTSKCGRCKRAIGTHRPRGCGRYIEDLIALLPAGTRDCSSCGFGLGWHRRQDIAEVKSATIDQAKKSAVIDKLKKTN